MKKNGFTLAEILVTLLVVGVVAALALPSFTADVQKRKIAPQLKKAVASFEQAILIALDNEHSDKISDANWTTPTAIFNNIANSFKGTVSSDGTKFTSSSGVEYYIPSDSLTMPNTVSNTIEALTSRTDSKKAFMIDLDGFNNGKNLGGADRFYFTLMDDGSLIPWGSEANSSSTVWTTKCPANGHVDTHSSYYCAAHVMENGRVSYSLVSPVTAPANYTNTGGQIGGDGGLSD